MGLTDWASKKVDDFARSQIRSQLEVFGRRVCNVELGDKDRREFLVELGKFLEDLEVRKKGFNNIDRVVKIFKQCFSEDAVEKMTPDECSDIVDAIGPALTAIAKIMK